MTMNVTLVRQRAHTNTKAWLPALISIADQLWAMVTPQFSAENRTDEAIDILRSSSATPEQCEWAERYLCGMAGANKEEHREGSRWQS